MENFSVTTLIDELRCNDKNKKINALKNLDKIAQVLGAERTRDELIPYVSELIDDEDEVLEVLAQELGKLLTHVGGESKVLFLLSPLE